MFDNPYRGEASLVVDGERRIIRFHWRALMELRADLGDQFDVKFTTALMSFDFEIIARVLAIGMREHWPDVSPDRIMQASPVVAETAVAVQAAWHRAFHGGAPLKEAAGERSENPLMRIARTAIRGISSFLRSRMPTRSV